MVTPYSVTLDLYRGASYAPYARQHVRVLGTSVLDACSKAERDLNVVLDDIEYAAAVDARPVWQPHPVAAAQAVALAA